MALAFRAASSIATGSSASSLTVNVPAGVQNNDILLAQVMLGSSQAVTTPAGWTLLAGPLADYTTSSVNAYVFWRVASSEPASYTFSFSGSANSVGCMLAYSGGDPSDPIDDIQTAVDSSLSTSHNASAVTTSRGGNLIVVLWGGFESNDFTWTPPSGMTERYDGGRKSASSYYVISADDMVKATAGSTGALTGTTDVSAGVTMVTVALNTAEVPITVTDATTLASTESASASVAITLADSTTLGSTETALGSELHDVADSSTLGSTEATSAVADANPQDTTALGSAESTGATSAVTTPDSTTLTSIEAPTIAATITPLADASTLGSSESVSIAVEPAGFGHRLRADVYDAAGNLLGDGPVVNVTAGNYRLALDEIGDYKLSIPATDARATLLATGREARLFREGEGALFRGLVDSGEIQVDAGDTLSLAIDGSSTARQLVFANTLLAREYTGATISAAVTDLLSGTGWTANITGVTTNLVNARYDGVSIWQALRHIADTFGWHVWEDNLTRTVTIGPAGTSTGLVLRNVEQAMSSSAEELAVIPLAGITILDEQTELWNRIIPLGGGEGVNVLTLQQSTRTTPYAVQSATGPDGRTYWYLEDSASVAAHGARTKVLSFKDAVPLANSDAEITNAANALYDMAAAWLGWHATVPESYEVQVVNLKHYDHGTPKLWPGATVRLVYRGIVEDESGAKRVWTDVDRELYVLAMERSFDESGADSWRLTVSTVDRPREDGADKVAQAIEDLWAIQTALKPYTMREIHGPSKESIDSSHPISFIADFDANVTYLHQAKLSLIVGPVRANATAAASGGGTTSSSGGSHSHTIDAQTTGEENPKHGHEVCQADNVTTWTDPAYQQQLVFATSVNAGSTFGVLIGRNGTTGAGTVLYTTGGTGHTHGVSATTSSSGGTHSHSVGAHTHSLTYGVFEASNPATPQLRVIINGTDRTAELGGPWNDDVTLDVTPFLVNANGQPLRQQNEIRIQSSQLASVVTTLKSIVTVSSLIPV